MEKVCLNGNLIDFNGISDYTKITKIALQDLTEKMVRQIGKMLNRYHDIFYSRSQAANKSSSFTMDISNIHATKNKAIKYIINSLRIPKAEVMAIGDNFNDLSLFTACGVKIAMSNAVAELKRKADFEAPNINHDGVAYILNNMLVIGK